MHLRASLLKRPFPGREDVVVAEASAHRFDGRSAALRRLRVQLTYLWRHRRFANLAEPRLLTEHIQRRKLEDRDPRMPQLADKVLVKRHVGQLLGDRWLTPTLWQGATLPVWPLWPMPFVVKSRHGCGDFKVVSDSASYEAARRQSAKWVTRQYGRWLDEWLYEKIEKGLLVEPFLGRGRDLPVDYKLFVFGAAVRYVQVHIDRAQNHRWIVFDVDWRRVSPATSDSDPERPATLDQMITAAEKLGKGFDFVRVDFYQIDGCPVFGELTFYPGSGLERVSPTTLDATMGMLWSDARRKRKRDRQTEDKAEPS